MAQSLQVLLLPERRRFTGQNLSNALAAKMRQMRESVGIPGESAQLQRYFQCLPSQWPMAALCRQAEFADAADRLWLRADPIHLQVEMRGARVMAWDTLQLSKQDSLAIFNAIRPVFGDVGHTFFEGSEGCFYINIARGTTIPEFKAAPEMLGADLYTNLPADRKWMALFNECQVILHNHDFNLDRRRRGLPAINGLWFWGQGVLPQALKHPFLRIDSTALDLRALSAFPVTAQQPERTAALIDCRHIRDWSQVEDQLATDGCFRLDFSDGSIWHWQPHFKWFFWQRRSFRFS